MLFCKSMALLVCVAVEVPDCFICWFKRFVCCPMSMFVTVDEHCLLALSWSVHVLQEPVLNGLVEPKLGRMAVSVWYCGDVHRAALDVFSNVGDNLEKVSWSTWLLAEDIFKIVDSCLWFWCRDGEGSTIGLDQSRKFSRYLLRSAKKLSSHINPQEQEAGLCSPCFNYSGNFGRVIVRWHRVKLAP